MLMSPVPVRTSVRVYAVVGFVNGLCLGWLEVAGEVREIRRIGFDDELRSELQGHGYAGDLSSLKDQRILIRREKRLHLADEEIDDRGGRVLEVEDGIGIRVQIWIGCEERLVPGIGRYELVSEAMRSVSSKADVASSVDAE